MPVFILTCLAIGYMILDQKDIRKKYEQKYEIDEGIERAVDGLCDSVTVLDSRLDDLDYRMQRLERWREHGTD